MLLKRTLLVILFFGICFISRAQNLPIVNLLVSNSDATIRTLDLPLKYADLSIDLKGELIINDPWADIVYFTKADGESLRGKISMVDGVPVKYYDRSDGFDHVGKIKSVGNIRITYYDRFDNRNHYGKIKTLGGTPITYIDQFDSFDNLGKVKSIGDIKVTYYDRFERELSGKFKSIGDITITYYDRFSSSDVVGKIKAIKGKSYYVHVYKVAPNTSFDK